MVKMISTHLAVLALAIGSSIAFAQVSNQIVSVGFTNGGITPTSGPSNTPDVAWVAPGAILTLFTTALNMPDAVATEIPLPTSLSGVSVQVSVVGAKDTTGYPALLPILRVYTQNSTVMQPSGAPCTRSPNSVLCSNTQVTVEIPTERVCAPFPRDRPCPDPKAYGDFPPLLVINVRANGVTGPDLPLLIRNFAQPHLLNSCDSIFGPQKSGSCNPLITHADATLVTNSNPARVGEVITIYAVGLGFDFGPPLIPKTGYASEIPIPTSLGAVVFQYSYPPPETPTSSTVRVTAASQSLVEPEWAGLLPGYVGLYQINVTVPPAPSGVYPKCDAELGNAQIIKRPSSTVHLCVQP